MADAKREHATARRREVFQQWLAGQAARIAHALREGEACPVCGSQEHHQPAHAGEHAVSDESLQAAERQQELAEAAHREALAALGQAEQQLASLRGMVEALSSASEPVSAEELHAQLRLAQQTLVKGEKAAEDLAQRQRRLHAARQALADSESKLQAAQAALLGANNTLQQRAGQREELQRSVPSELANLPALEQAIAQVVRQREQLQAALQRAEATAMQAAQAVVRAGTLVEESTAACQRLAEMFTAHSETLEDNLRAAAFPDLQAYSMAKLEDAAVEALDTDTRRFDQELAAARERVERARAQVHDQQRPDLVARSAEHEAAQAGRLAASNAVRDALAALEHTSGYVASLAQIAQEFRQLDDRHAVLRSVADLATGNNVHRMSFQRYVLATLLEEVLAATTLRLRVMSRGRYELRRTLDAADARSAGGLDLEVFDHYTGSTRAVSTLSGGESFLASLALALGLSDAVQSYAGGTRLDAIFVDEGFGTLDPEALDFAIRTLKDLQRGGRMVGIISHVAELKEWIDARLELKPTQAGSRAAFVV
jgi:DNA repair protein SbcC/Rad50